MLDVPSISAIVAAVGVLVGVALTVQELRHLAKSRRTDSFWRIASTFNGKEYLEAIMQVYSLEFKDYDDFTRKYGELLTGKCEVAVPISMVCNLFESAAFLLHNELIEYDMVALFPVKATWEKVKTIVEGARKRSGFSGLWRNFEFLANETKKGQ